MTVDTPITITYAVEVKAVFHNEQWHPAVTIKSSSGEGVTRRLEMGFTQPRFALPYARALAEEYQSAFVGIQDPA